MPWGRCATGGQAVARGEGRSNICEAAVRLFNEQGYDSVSLRQIAAEAGTTIGNLTYHFRRKEDLLAAILTDLHQGFSESLDRSLRGRDLVARLLELFVENEANHARYPFYFENLSQIMTSSPSIKAENDAFARDLYEYYRWAFGQLVRDGWLSHKADGGTPSALAYVLIAMQSGWVQASSPYRNELLPTIALPKAAATLLRTHVADAMLAEYDEACVEVGIAV